MGNPPYLGYTQQDKEQKKDICNAWTKYNGAKNLDYISIWFIKASEYIKNTKSKVAFVSTNSVCQGDSVSSMWKPIFALNVDIFIAYRSFKWKNNAKHNAGVSCTIIGLSDKKQTNNRRIYNDNSYTSTSYINAYLLDAPNVIIERNTKPFGNIPEMVKGSMPADGGHLILSHQEKEELIKEHNRVLFKRLMGSYEFINDEERFCLWITDANLNIALATPEIQERIESVKAMRLNSPKQATIKDADRPHQFSEIRYQHTDAIIVPRVSSERREYIPIGFVDKDTVISDSAFAVYDAELWLFALLTSKIHNVWVRTVGGRLKTDYRYSATLCYNTFPFPKITKEQKERLTELAEEVLLTRENHTEMTLGEMYNPETMPDDLKEAHHELDIAVEQCYRPEPFTSDDERLEYLFKLYEK